MYQLDKMCNLKPPVKWMIGVSLLVENLFRDNKKNNVHIIVKPIYSAFRSESITIIIRTIICKISCFLIM